MKQRVVFLFYHGLGHVNACLKIARILQEANFEVYFAGVPYFQQYISLQGFLFYPLESIPFGKGLEKWVNSNFGKKHIYFSTLVDRITDRLYTEREADLYWMLESLKPTTVLLDAMQATDFIALYGRLKSGSIRLGLMHTMLPTLLSQGRPPMNSEISPDDESGVDKATRATKWQRVKKIWKNKILYVGFDDTFIINRRLKRNLVPASYVSKTLGLLNFNLCHVEEFIIAPREFDFPNFEPELTQHYIGFLTDENRNEQLAPENRAKLRDIYTLKETKKMKLVYCSFGTIEPKEMKTIDSFLNTLISIAGEKNLLLVIALKAKVAISKSLANSENVYLFPSVPQLELLRHTDVFITHGGLNSIKEAIHAEVPMLVYPIHPNFDPKGNSARVTFHGLGISGSMLFDSQREVEKKINELFSNPRYKKRIQELKAKDSRYLPSQFLQKFNALKIPR